MITNVSTQVLETSPTKKYSKPIPHSKALDTVSKILAGNSNYKDNNLIKLVETIEPGSIVKATIEGRRPFTVQGTASYAYGSRGLVLVVSQDKKPPVEVTLTLRGFPRDAIRILSDGKKLFIIDAYRESMPNLSSILSHIEKVS